MESEKMVDSETIETKISDKKEEYEEKVDDTKICKKLQMKNIVNTKKQPYKV